MESRPAELFVYSSDDENDLIDKVAKEITEIIDRSWENDYEIDFLYDGYALHTGDIVIQNIKDNEYNNDDRIEALSQLDQSIRERLFIKRKEIENDFIREKEEKRIAREQRLAEARKNEEIRRLKELKEKYPDC